MARKIDPMTSRRRRLRRRGRLATVRQWLGAMSVGGFAVIMMTVTLFGLIGH